MAPLTDGDDTVVDVLRYRCDVNIIKYSERDKIMSFLHDVGTFCRTDGNFSYFLVMEKYLNTSLSADCSPRVYDCGLRPPGASTCRQIFLRRPLTSLEVLRRLQTPSTRLRCVPPLTDGAAAGTRRGETDASGLHGGGLAVALSRMLLQSVPMG